MKRIASILTGLTFAVLLSVAAAQAQSVGQKITANIPFEFTVGSISFPAGQYQFVRNGSGLYVVRDENGRSQMIMSGVPVVQASGTTEKTNLKFASVDGHHVLVQIWSDLADSGNEFPESSKHAAIDGAFTNQR